MRRLLLNAAALGCMGLTLCAAPLLAVDMPANESILDDGFRDLYNLSFQTAHAAFGRWESMHPDDARGPVFDAAAYLFSEFHRLKILQTNFFTDDKAFEDRDLHPDPALKLKFDAALQKSVRLASAELQRNPQDENALFATVLRLGLQADYLSLLQHRDMEALKQVKEGRQQAQTLLNRYPNCYDAYIAVGVENYLLSLKPAPVRWFLHATGAETDKETGIANLKLTAAKGHYLQPYAELLLAVAALRDKNKPEARRLLTDLSTRFPRNPLYREELSKLVRN